MKLVIGYSIFLMVSILCLMICIGYLIIRRFIYPSSIPSLEGMTYSIRIYIMLNTLFFLLLSYSIISIYLRPDPYIRPLGYFISISLMAVIVANEILFLQPKKSYIRFTLCKIIIIGLSLQYSQILIFPSIVGVDPWWHQWFTLNILDQGHIPEGLEYSKLPLMQLMIGMTSLITDLGYKVATMFSISSLQVICDALFVFLLGKFLISTKVGLLAALLLEVANSHILFGYWTIPNTMAATLILPIIFIYFKLRRDNSFISTLLTIFIMGTLILTHTITSMCLAILIFVFWLSSTAYARLFDEKINQSVNWTICILFSTVMFAYWSYISGHILTLANLIKMGFYNPLVNWRYSSLYYIPLLERAVHHLGKFLYFGFSFIGCFYMSSKQFRNSNRFITIIGGMIILGLDFLSIIMMKDIISNRWDYFSQILMAVPLSLSLLLLNGIFKNRFIKIFLMSLSIFSLSFLLIISSLANIDNRFFSPNIGVRSAFTESELQAMKTISEIWNGTIGCDRYGRIPYIFQLNREFADIDDSLYSGDFTDLQDIMILVREEIVKHSFFTSRGLLKLKYNLHIALDNQNFSNIYDCGSVNGYLQN